MRQPREIIVIGSLNLDLVATVPRFPQPGETITGSTFERHTGGKGANQAVAASLAGAHVCMVARHGTDGFEIPLLATLKDAGVDTSTILPAAGPSGVAVILVTDAGQNSIVVVPGSNGRLTPADIAAQHSRIASAALILTQLETPLDVLARTLALATAANIPVMLDPAPVQPIGRELLHQVTWLTPNETEAAALLGEPVPDTLDLALYAQRLRDLGPKNLLLKLGARGAFLATADGLRQHIPGHTVRAVDTTAAGDALNGAFAAALAAGADPVEAARFGVAAAALSVTRPGAIPSLARRSEIESFRAAL
jgi:ribokinase